MIQELLRDTYNYNGVVCTDWGIVKDYVKPWQHSGTPWGMENSSEAERRLKVFEAGVDQLGGVTEIAPSLDAYKLWGKSMGQKVPGRGLNSPP